MNVKLLIEHRLEFLCLKGGCTGSSESTLVKMPHCWKLHVTAQLVMATHRASIDDFDQTAGLSLSWAHMSTCTFCWIAAQLVFFLCVESKLPRKLVINQLINQASIQPTNQSTNHPTNQSIKQASTRPINQS